MDTHAVVVLGIAVYVCVEMIKLSSNREKKLPVIQDTTAAPEAVMQSAHCNDLIEQVKSLIVERNDLRERVSKLNTMNNDLNNKLYQADWKIKETGRHLEDERRNVRSLQSELSQTKKQVNQLRDKNDDIKRRIDFLENDCDCLCSSIDAARYCVAKTYRVATHYVRKLPLSNILLGLLDQLFDLVMPATRGIEQRRGNVRFLN